MLGFSNLCSIQLQLAKPAKRSYYTNEDHLQGFILLKNKLTITEACLDVLINSGSLTIRMDNKGTFLTCENRLIFTSLILVLKHQSFPPGLHRIPFKFVLPGASDNPKVFNLPPSMNFEGKECTKIDYTVDATFTLKNHLPLHSSVLFEFRPQPQFTLYSLRHNSVFPASSTDAGFLFSYSALAQGPYNKSRPSLPSRKKVWRFSAKERRGDISTETVECPFAVLAEFHHAKVGTDGKFAKGVITVPSPSLSDQMSLYLILKFSPEEIYSKIFHEEPKGESLPEKVRITLIRIDLESVLLYCANSQISKSNRKVCLMGKSALDHTVDLSLFKKIRTKQGEFYRYELEPSVYECIIRHETNSFISLSVKLDHQFQITMEFASEVSDSKAKVVLNTDVLLLNKLVE